MSTPVLIPPAPFESDAIDKTGAVSGTPAIRKFKDVDLNAQIDKAIASLPPETAGVVVAYATLEGARLAFIGQQEVGPGELDWSVSLAVPWEDAPKNLEFEAMARYSWPKRR